MRTEQEIEAGAKAAKTLCDEKVCLQGAPVFTMPEWLTLTRRALAAADAVRVATGKESLQVSPPATVPVRVAVAMNPWDGTVEIVQIFAPETEAMAWAEMEKSGYVTRICIATIHVPIPSVPTVTASVEVAE